MNVMCVGDSITFGQHLPMGTPAWPARIGAIGRGVCGETTRQALERFPRDVQEHPADVTILQWGHNDANRWQTDAGLPRVSQRAFVANLMEMIERCRAIGSRPVLCSITPTRKNPEYDAEIIVYDLAVRQVAQRMNVSLADVRTEFLSYALDDLLMPDGLHLTEEGHELYAAVVTWSLARRLVAA